jgi:phosphatidylglycerophosphate synthase
VRVFDIGGPEALPSASDRILTVPNALSLARIAVLPLVYLDLLSGRLVRALVLMIAITASDWFDGYLARVLDQRTRLGAVLDPLGDRAVFIVVGVMAAAAIGGGPGTPLRWLELAAGGGLAINIVLTYAATLGYARAALGPRS